jgi:hypothetical protein
VGHEYLHIVVSAGSEPKIGSPLFLGRYIEHYKLCVKQENAATYGGSRLFSFNPITGLSQRLCNLIQVFQTPRFQFEFHPAHMSRQVFFASMVLNVEDIGLESGN